MEPICLSPSILTLKLTPAEKILLARICQRAGLDAGRCTDSNSELAQATAMHLKTVSVLVGRLVEAELLQTSINPDQANKRILTPSAAIMADYPSITDSTLSDYPPFTDSTGVGYPPITDSTTLSYPSITDSPSAKTKMQAKPQQRLCPVTGVDITHQPQEHKVVTRATLRALVHIDRPRFDSLAAEFLTPEQVRLGAGAAPMQLNLTIRKLASMQRYENEPQTRAPKLNERLCPITGVDIGRQRTDVRYVTRQTLERLARKNPPTYSALLAWLLPDEDPDMTYPRRQSNAMADCVRELASSGLPIPPLPLPVRRCPVTNIDLSHQSPDYSLVTASTLKRLAGDDPDQFNQVTAQFLGLKQGEESTKWKIRALVSCVRRAANPAAALH